MLLRRQTRSFLMAIAGFYGKVITVTSNVAGAVTVTCKPSVFSLLSLQAWLLRALAQSTPHGNGQTSPLAGQSLIWLPCAEKGDGVLVKFTTTQLKVSELGKQHNSTYAMSAQRVLDEEALANAALVAAQAMANPEQAPPEPEVTLVNMVTSGPARRQRRQNR